MKVTLKKRGEIVAELAVGDDGALSVRTATEQHTFSVKESRRIAGAILERSLQDGLKQARARARNTLDAALDELFRSAFDGEDG